MPTYSTDDTIGKRRLSSQITANLNTRTKENIRELHFKKLLKVIGWVRKTSKQVSGITIVTEKGFEEGLRGWTVLVDMGTHIVIPQYIHGTKSLVTNEYRYLTNQELISNAFKEKKVTVRNFNDLSELEEAFKAGMDPEIYKEMMHERIRAKSRDRVHSHGRMHHTPT